MSQKLPFYPVILCFTSSDGLPDYCFPMKRNPMVKTGINFSENFGTVLEEAISKNSAIHDGAIVFQKTASKNDYSLIAWSVRLAPPNSTGAEIDNRGSAYNSSLSMSVVPDIEIMVLIGTDTVSLFVDGHGYDLDLVK